MPPAKTHQDFMKLVCGVCTRKDLKLRSISSAVLELIQKHHYSGYNLISGDFPSVVCNSCYAILNFINNDPETSKTLPDIDYDKRANSRGKGSCQCLFCKVGRLNGKAYHDHKSQIRPKKRKPIVEVAKICQSCKGEIKRGIDHICNKTARKENVLSLVRSLSPASKQRVTGELINDACTEQNTSTKNGTLTLATSGKPKTIHFGKQEPPKRFSKEHILMLKNSMGISGATTEKMSAGIRIIFGKQSVEPYTREYLTEVNNCLRDHFVLEEFDVIKKTGTTLTQMKRQGVMCKNIDEFIKLLIKERCLDPDNHEVIFGLDDGGKMIKLMMTIKESPQLSDINCGKSRDKDSILSKTFKLSSVKKLFVVGLLPASQENYHNIKSMLDKVNINAIDMMTLSADIKLYLTVLGKQHGKLKYACIYCFGKAPWETEAPLMTIGNLHEYNQKFVDDNAPLKDAQKYMNVVNKPLITGDPNTLTMDIINFPQLHCLTGASGKLIAAIETLVGKEIKEKFFKRNNIHETEYQGSHSFEGNMARKLLKKIGNMREDIVDLPQEKKLAVEKVIETIEALNDVVKSCFAVKIEGDYSSYIQKFSQLYRSLNISITTKVHLIESHICQFLERKNVAGAGLGMWSEQSFEAAHHDFKVEWQRTCVSVENENFGEHIFDALVRLE